MTNNKNLITPPPGLVAPGTETKIEINFALTPSGDVAPDVPMKVHGPVTSGFIIARILLSAANQIIANMEHASGMPPTPEESSEENKQ